MQTAVHTQVSPAADSESERKTRAEAPASAVKEFASVMLVVRYVTEAVGSVQPRVQGSRMRRLLYSRQTVGRAAKACLGAKAADRARFNRGATQRAAS